MTPKQYAKFNNILEKQQNKVAKIRDELDNQISEMEQLREDCQEAWDNLGDARDALSRTQ